MTRGAEEMERIRGTRGIYRGGDASRFQFLFEATREGLLISRNGKSGWELEGKGEEDNDRSAGIIRWFQENLVLAKKFRLRLSREVPLLNTDVFAVTQKDRRGDVRLNPRVPPDEGKTGAHTTPRRSSISTMRKEFIVRDPPFADHAVMSLRFRH